LHKPAHMAAASREAVIFVATREQLADFVLSGAPLLGNVAELADFAQVFDRTQFISRAELIDGLGKTSTYLQQASPSD